MAIEATESTLTGASAMRIPTGLLLGLVAVTAVGAEHYGAPLTMKTAVTLEAAVQSLGDRPSATVLVESTVVKVCPDLGCWIALKSTSSQLHVTFKDEAFFVPSTLIGKTVLVEGKLTKAGAGYALVASGLEVKS